MYTLRMCCSGFSCTGAGTSGNATVMGQFSTRILGNGDSLKVIRVKNSQVYFEVAIIPHPMIVQNVK